MRRRRPEIRTILPDTKYNDMAVAKFINYIMNNGKKGVAEKIFYGAMDIIQAKTKTDGIKIFKKGIENTSPSVEVKSRRIGGATYQVPIEVPKKELFILPHYGSLILQIIQQVNLCQKNWLVSLSRQRMAKVMLSKRRKILTEWQMPIKHLRILDK